MLHTDGSSRDSMTHVMSNELLFVVQQKTRKPKLLNEYTRVNSAYRNAPDTWGYAVRPMLQRWRMRPDGTIQLMGPGCRSKQHRLQKASHLALVELQSDRRQPGGTHL